jgi:type IV pilus assembly protein PilX
MTTARRQKGVALIVSLILLVLATLIGLAAVRGTNLQEHMSANMYDRSLAFQRAESALRAAETAITLNGNINDLRGVDCRPVAAVTCPVIPDNTFTGTSANWVTVDTTHAVNSDKTPGTPQYFIQFMATGSADSSYDLGSNADAAAYGAASVENVAYYRITARSSAPGDAVDRAIVVLQSTVKRSF